MSHETPTPDEQEKVQALEGLYNATQWIIMNTDQGRVLDEHGYVMNVHEDGMAESEIVHHAQVVYVRNDERGEVYRIAAVQNDAVTPGSTLTITPSKYPANPHDMDERAHGGIILVGLPSERGYAAASFDEALPDEPSMADTPEYLEMHTKSIADSRSLTREEVAEYKAAKLRELKLRRQRIEQAHAVMRKQFDDIIEHSF